MTDPRKALEDRLASATETLESLFHIGRSIVALVPVIQNDLSAIRTGLALFPPATDSAYNEPAPMFPPQTHDGREIVTEAAPAATGVEEGADAVGAGREDAERTAQSAQAITESGPDQSGPLLDVEDLPENLCISQFATDAILDLYAEKALDADQQGEVNPIGSAAIAIILRNAREIGDPRMKAGDRVKIAQLEAIRDEVVDEATALETAPALEPDTVKAPFADGRAPLTIPPRRTDLGKKLVAINLGGNSVKFGDKEFFVRAEKMRIISRLNDQQMYTSEVLMGAARVTSPAIFRSHLIELRPILRSVGLWIYENGKGHFQLRPIVENA